MTPPPPTTIEPTPERQQFEDWYTLNAFDIASAPVGSRDCDLQWRAWCAARGLNSVGYPGTDLGPHPSPTGPNAMSPMNPDAPWNRRQLSAKDDAHVGEDGIVKAVSIECVEGDHQDCKHHYQVFRWDCVCACHETVEEKMEN